MKSVSIVIPTYNRINMLKQCLASFEGLNYPKEYFEIIIVDDGSTDRSYENLKDVINNLLTKYGLSINPMADLLRQGITG